MAMNHVHSQNISPQSFYDQQVFVIHGPIPETQTQWQALCKWIGEHPIWSVIVAAVLLLGLEYLWAMLGHPGGATLFHWRVELLTVGLSCLTIFLFFTFRRWERERQWRATAKRERIEEINALLCTPPPLPLSVNVRTEEEFAITIEYWASDEPIRLTEDSIVHAQLPDEFLAPDALVLNFEVREANLRPQ